MKNKIAMLAGTAALSLMIAASPASAAATHVDNGSGFYLGAYGGYGWGDAEIPGPDAEVNGGDYGVFLGYELTNFLNSNNVGMTAAFEIQAGWSGADDTVGGVRIEKDMEFGASFRPGFAFLDTASLKPYGIIGWRHTEYDITGGGIGDQDFDGLELGLGTEVMAMDNWGVRLEYAHVFYGSEGGVDPDEDDLRVGVAYHF